jgi:AcrR family transcriptional regulator
VTLYRHFPSKDDLISGYLQRRGRYDRDQVAGLIAALPDDPRSRRVRSSRSRRRPQYPLPRLLESPHRRRTPERAVTRRAGADAATLTSICVSSGCANTANGSEQIDHPVDVAGGRIGGCTSRDHENCSITWGTRGPDVGRAIRTGVGRADAVRDGSWCRSCRRQGAGCGLPALDVSLASSGWLSRRQPVCAPYPFCALRRR